MCRQKSGEWSQTGWKGVRLYINIPKEMGFLSVDHTAVDAHSVAVVIPSCSNPFLPQSSTFSRESSLLMPNGSLQETFERESCQEFLPPKTFFFPVQLLNYLKEKLRLCFCIQSFSLSAAGEGEQAGGGGGRGCFGCLRCVTFSQPCHKFGIRIQGSH